MLHQFKISILWTFLLVSSILTTAKDCGEWTDIHGQYLPTLDRHEFECPDNGGVYGVEYTTDNSRINSIKFNCKSSMGYTSTDIFGSPSGETVTKDCVKKYAKTMSSYIKNFYGNIDVYLSDLKIRCMWIYNKYERNRTSVGNVTFDEFIPENSHFDDKCYSQNLKRPVKIRVYTKGHVYAIQIQYKNIPIEYNCKETRLELKHGDTFPLFEEIQVVGTTGGATCSSTEQKISLSISLSKSYSTTSTSSSSHAATFGGEATATVGAGLKIPFTEKYLNFKAGTPFSVELGTEWTSGEYFTKDNSTETSTATTINYQGPGAAVVVGYMKVYKMSKNTTEINRHYTCENSSKPFTKDEIFIGEKVYGHVQFQDYHFPFKNTKCTTKLRACILSIEINLSIKNFKLFGVNYKNEVHRCLNKK